MDPLGDLLKTRPILAGWEFTMEPYLSGQFGFIDNPDRKFGNGSVWARPRTRSDGPEPLLTLSLTTPTNSDNDLRRDTGNLSAVLDGRSDAVQDLVVEIWRN